MKVTIYQIIPELDFEKKVFRSLDLQGKVYADLYERVFEGDLEIQNLEEVFEIFNIRHPAGYKGRSLSVSDVVELEKSPGKSEFFFCDPVGFKRIKFSKQNAMDPIVNHNFECICKLTTEVNIYFMRPKKGFQDVYCKDVIFERFKYSSTQLGYQLLYTNSADKFITVQFLDRPQILVSPTRQKIPRDYIKGEENGQPKYHICQELKRAREWLTENGCEFEEW